MSIQVRGYNKHCKIGLRDDGPSCRPIKQIDKDPSKKTKIIVIYSKTVRIASDYEIREKFHGRDEHAADAERALPEADQDQVHLERGWRQEKVPRGRGRLQI